jgi:hypothetical protein
MSGFTWAKKLDIFIKMFYRKEILISDYSRWSFEDFLEFFKRSGCPYFMWNDRVYTLTNHDAVIETNYTINDIQ